MDTSCWTNTPAVASWLRSQNMTADDGVPMCECGARAGVSCGADPDRRFIIDEEAPATERAPTAV